MELFGTAVVVTASIEVTDDYLGGTNWKRWKGLNELYSSLGSPLALP